MVKRRSRGRVPTCTAHARLDVNADAIVAARGSANLTREQIAVAAGLSNTTLYLAEYGKASRLTLSKLAAVFGVSPDVFEVRQ